MPNYELIGYKPESSLGRKRIEGSEVAIIDGASHMSQFTHPNIFNRHIVDFEERRVKAA